MPADPANDLILITAAGGKQAADLVPQLLAAPTNFRHVRLQVRSEASRKVLQQRYPTADVVNADLGLVADCERIMHGVACCYAIGPTFHPDETQVIKNLIDAASSRQKANGKGEFVHFVYSSVLHPILAKLDNHDAKRLAEEFLAESPLDYTVLQPSHFCDNFPIRQIIEQIEKQGNAVYSSNSSPDMPFCFSTTYDTASAAVKVICEREQHYAATYEIVSIGVHDALDYRQAVDCVAKAVGHGIEIKERSLDETIDFLKTGPVARGFMADSSLGTARKLFGYYDKRGLYGNSNVLEWLIGRKPLSYQAWADMKVEQTRQQIRIDRREHA